MILSPLEAEDVETVAGWLGDEANYRWLDFGHGVQALSPASLRIMSQRDLHDLRVFTSDDDTTPIGLVALSDIDRRFETATLWYVLGDKSFSRGGYTSRAVRQLVDEGFASGLQAIRAWAVEANTASVRVLEKCGFTLAGRARQSHVIEGERYDRLLFDVISSEWQR